jgi:hypothetical protein
MLPLAAMPLWKKLLVAGTALVALFAVVGFFVAPPIVKSRILRELRTRLGRVVTVGAVAVNPFELSVSIRDLRIQDKDGKPFASWDRAEFNYRFTSLLSRHHVFDALRFERPYARFVINADGSLNVDDLLQIFRATPAEAEAGPPAVWRFEAVRVTDATVGFTDRQRSPTFETTVGPFALSLDRLSTENGSESPYGFEGRTESGETFSWHGRITSHPLRSSGELALGNVTLPKYRPYYQTGQPFRVREGKVTLKAAYDFVWTDTEKILRVKGADLALADAVIGRLDVEAPDITLQSLTITGADVDLLTHEAKIDTIAVLGGRILIQNDPAHGGVNLHQMIRPYLEAPVAPSQAPPAPFSVGTLAISGVTVAAEDLKPSRPFKVEAHDVALTVKGIDNRPGTTCPTTLSARFGDTGTVKVGGTFAADFHHGDLDVEVDRVDMRPTDVYLEPYAHVWVANGSVGAKGHVDFDLPDVGDMKFKYAGDLRLNDLALVNAVDARELFRLSLLRLAPFAVELGPAKASLGEVTIEGPRLSVGVMPDRTLDVARVLVAPSESAAPPAATPAAPLPHVTIDTVRVSGGSIRMDDRSVEPNVSIALTRLAGTVKGISTDELARASVDLTAMLDNVAPVAIKGQINPIARKDFTDLKMNVTGIDLLTFSPYCGKYLGYGIGKGKMAADLSYAISERHFKSTNVFTIDQFELGSKVESADAMHVPMKLAVAVLRDRNGQIVLDVPAEGSVDDPEFRLGRVIVRAIVNVLTKIVTSPFRLLASAFGGAKDQDVAYQDFAPGSAALAESERQKLGIVAKSMLERPDLSLAIEGSVDPVADGQALTQARILGLLRTAKWKGTGAASPESVTIAPEETGAWLRAAYDAAFPPPSPPPEIPPTADEMQAKLATTVPLTADDLHALASDRGKAVRDYLIETGQIAAERLFLTEDAEPDPERKPASRVWLTLK